jgi:hypothetical protein
MDVGVGYNWLADPTRPAHRFLIEVIQRRRVKSVELDGVEQVRVLLEKPPHTACSRVERVRRNDKPRRLGFPQPSQLLEGVCGLRFSTEIEQQHVLARDGSFHA